jgi:iron complex outermembrane receptor protein
LGSEKLESYELGYLGQWLDRRMFVDVRIYRDRLKDMITEIFVPAPSVISDRAFSHANFGEVVVEGVDTRIDWRLRSDTRLALTYAYADASGTNVTDPAVRNQRRRLESVPDKTMSALLIHRFSPYWEASAGYYRVGYMLWMGRGDELDGYERLDLRLARRLRFGRTHGELTLVAQNALDKEHQDFVATNIADRRVFATLAMELP